jgi:hypothetical protein
MTTMIPRSVPGSQGAQSDGPTRAGPDERFLLQRTIDVVHEGLVKRVKVDPCLIGFAHHFEACGRCESFSPPSDIPLYDIG